MAFQSVPDTAQITFTFNVGAELIANIFYAEHSGAYNQAGITALAAGLDSALAGGWKAALGNQDAYVSVVVRGLTSENDLTAESSAGAGPGTVASIPMPLNVSFVVTQDSGFTGRSARGRTYVCGISRTSVDPALDRGSYVIPAFAAAWVAVIDGVRIAIDNIGLWDPVLVSRYHAGSKRTVGTTFPWIASHYNSLKYATRRSRLR